MIYNIPFNKPYLTGKETEYIRQAVADGKISGNGAFTKRCQQFFDERIGFCKDGKLLCIILCLLNILFLVYWILLSSNYCLHYDDAHFMWKLRDYSMFDYIKEMYMSRGGNFIGYGINAILFTISNYIGSYRFWSIIFYMIGISLLYASVNNIKLSIHKIYILTGIITFYNIYVLTSIDLAVFNWICAMSYYLYAPIICLLLKYINASTLKWWQSCFMILLALFIAGNSVSISTVFFVVLFINGLYWCYRKGWNIGKTWQVIQVRRLSYIALFMLIIFAIVVIAPGNYSRLESGDCIEQPQNIFEFMIACCKCMGMYIYMMSFYIIYHLLIFVFGYIIGTKSKHQLIFSQLKAVLIITGIFLLYLLISVIPLAYLSNGFQMQRNYTHICFFYLLCIFFIGYVLGNGKCLSKNKACVVGELLAIFMIVIVSLNIHQDIPVARAYREAHEERETYLTNLQKDGNKDIVYVDPYPSVTTPDAKYNVLKFLGKSTSMQAIYYYSDTGYVPNEYESHIRHLLQLDYDFILTTDVKQASINQ